MASANCPECGTRVLLIDGHGRCPNCGLKVVALGIQPSIRILVVLVTSLIIVLGIIYGAILVFIFPVFIVTIIYSIYYWGKRLDENLPRIENRLDRVIELLEPAGKR